MEELAATILSAHPCHLGEGPAYEASGDTAWWLDILEKTLFEARVSAGTVTMHALPTMASVIAPIDAARQLVAADDGLHVRDRASGRLTHLQRLEEDGGRTRSNDGRVHPCGALWIGTMGKAAEAGAGAIHWYFRGEARRLYERITIPNAICFSADGATGYFVDTRAGVLKRVALDPSSGLPAGEPEDFYDHRGGEGGLDGAVIDSQGLIWCARWGAGCVDAYSPDGRRVRTVRVPAMRVTCPAFVGRSLDRLLVTSASEGLSEAEKRADPLHGQSFLLDVGARGLPEPVARPFA